MFQSRPKGQAILEFDIIASGPFLIRARPARANFVSQKGQVFFCYRAVG
mgnify:CR=1 FL=1